jgi:hypothetical protein
LSADPAERKNVIRKKMSIAKDLDQRLRDYVRTAAQAKSPKVSATAPDTDLIERLRALGY